VKTPTAPFLLPTGFARPGASALLRELRVVPEVGRATVRLASSRVSCGPSDPAGNAEPILLIPGFMAGDPTLNSLSRHLRGRGFRTYRSSILANISCTWRTSRLIETRLESIAERRGTKVRIVGHSLGGMLARGIAVRRPELVSGIVTLGSPVLAPGAHHAVLASNLEMLVRLSRYGVRLVMTADCVGGDCARQSFDDMRKPLPEGVDFTAIYSRRDGIVDWRACLDPEAEPVEVPSSHIGMAFDPRTGDAVIAALLRQIAAGELPLDEVG
jgi:triacylglycerol lipase